MKNTKKKTLLCAGIVILLFCTAISIYGILSAPEPDQSALEEELKRNEQALAESNSAIIEEIDSEEVDSEETDSEETDSEGNDSKEAEATEKPKEKKELISVIGDSVFLGAAPAFQKIQKNAIVDAKISRQVYQGLDVAKKMKKKGKLGNIVIISLGINGKFNEVTGQELIDYLGKSRTIYWINAYGKKLPWQKDVNKTIQTLVDKNENLHLISWSKEAPKHPDWFYQDGTHLNTTGQSGFSRFIQEELGKGAN